MTHARTSPIIVRAFERSLKVCDPPYPARHTRAFVEPSSPAERAIGGMLRALADYADGHEARFESKIMDDGVLGPAWADMLKGFRALLNGECGRFDCGALDAAACDLFVSAGGKADEL